jgi:hypothetical protein
MLIRGLSKWCKKMMRGGDTWVGVFLEGGLSLGMACIY